MKPDFAHSLDVRGRRWFFAAHVSSALAGSAIPSVLIAAWYGHWIWAGLLAGLALSTIGLARLCFRHHMGYVNAAASLRQTLANSRLSR